MGSTKDWIFLAAISVVLIYAVILWVKMKQVQRRLREKAAEIYISGLRDAENRGKSKLEGKDLEAQVDEINRGLRRDSHK